MAYTEAWNILREEKQTRSLALLRKQTQDLDKHFQDREK